MLSGADRALYYRQLRDTVRTTFLPELTSARAIDAAGLVDRILVQFIVEAENDLDGVDIGDLEAERRFLERVDGLRAVVFGEPAAGGAGADGCSMTGEQLARYLRDRLAASPDLTVKALCLVPGGRSKETIRVSLAGTAELPGEVIVRKDRPVGLLPTRASDEFEILKVVHDFGGVPVPEPFFADADGALGGGTLLVMECVRGAKAGEYFPDLAAPTSHREALGRHLAASLARLHSLPLERLATTKLADAAGAAPPTAEALVTAVDALVARIGELSGPSSAAVPAAREWLVDHVDAVARRERLCLLQGDFGFHNMLVDGPRVTALLDWEAAAVGPPARELAAAWNAATALLPWPAFVDAYLGAGGPEEATDSLAIAWYRVLTALGGYMTSRLGGHLFRTGAKRDLLTAHSGLDSHFRCARNLSRALADATAASTH